LPLVQEQRQAERYTDEAGRGDRHPAMSQPQPTTLELDEDDEYASYGSTDA